MVSYCAFAAAQIASYSNIYHFVMFLLTFNVGDVCNFLHDVFIDGDKDFEWSHDNYHH